jgi:small redox-active disulfide protein 2
MSANDIRQIRVGANTVGIIGLKQVLDDLAAEADALSDDDIKLRLMQALGKKNYIAPPARDRYEQAFFREYCRAVGRSVAPEPKEPGAIDIKILGPGCNRCDQLEREVMTIVADLKIQAAIDHVRDLKTIAEYGVLGTPALVINEDVKAVGSVPPRQKIITWINEVTQPNT